MWRQTWAEIHVDHLIHNVKVLKKKLGANVRFMATVKADAYGHGAVAISEAALFAGADHLGVASYEEGVLLRNAGIRADILVYGALPKSAAHVAVEQHLTATVGSMEDLLWLQDAAQALKSQAKIHVKIDTGMTRLGLRHIDETLALLQMAVSSPWIVLEGIFTHFSSADEEFISEEPVVIGADHRSEVSFIEQQRTRFETVVTAAERHGIVIPIMHAANSAAALRDVRYQYDMVRFGIAMYGYHPLPQGQASIGLYPVMAVRSRITRLAQIMPGEAVSYGRTYFATKPEVIATVAIGYADGIPRALSNIGRVMINGSCASIVGRICMDQLMVNVTGLSAVVGDVVTIYGEMGGCASLSEAAKQIDTIPYELLCRISVRVPRVMIPAKNLEETCH